MITSTCIISGQIDIPNILSTSVFTALVFMLIGIKFYKNDKTLDYIMAGIGNKI